jgi:hypothetical protein
VHGKAITEPGAVTLADVARDPNTFATKTFVVKGTVSAVCEHRGCWMELGDAGSSAHLRMSGHAFFVPRDSAGKQARVEARLVADPNAPMCDEAKEKTGCTAEAEKSLGRPLAKLQLEALGVEIYPAM